MKLRTIYLPLIVTVWIVTWPTKPVHGAAADREKILEGAKKEGRLVLYTGMETDESSLFTQEFAKKYPFIKPEIFRSSGEKVQARFMVEHRANTHFADIFQTSIVQVYQLKNSALLARYVSEEAPAYADGFKDAQGFWTAFYQIPYVIGYNTRLVAPKDVPASYEDLLNPKWKGQISLETEEYQWFYHLLQIMGRDKGLDFMRKICRAKFANAQRAYIVGAAGRGRRIGAGHGGLLQSRGAHENDRRADRLGAFQRSDDHRHQRDCHT